MIAALWPSGRYGACHGAADGAERTDGGETGKIEGESMNGETYWPLVKAMEAATAAQDPQYLIAFITALAERNLLNESMLVSLPYTTMSGGDRRAMWDTLHDLVIAGEKAKNETPDII